MVNRLPGFRSFLVVTATVALLSASFLITGCADQIVDSAPETDFSPPVAQQPLNPDPTMPPGTTEPVEPDAARGMEIFIGQTGNLSASCSSCHAISDSVIVGPGLQGLYQRAGGRVPGLDAAAYVDQSIRMPEAFIVADFTNIMPAFGQDQLDELDLQDLLAYLQEL